MIVVNLVVLSYIEARNIQMKTWNHILLTLTVLAGLCSSCSNNQPQSITPTATIFPVSSTATHAPMTPISQEDFSCWPVKPLQEGNRFKGSFVYAHYAPAPQGVAPKLEGLFTWDLSSLSSKPLNLSENAKNLFNTEGVASTGIDYGDTLVLLTKNNIAFVSYKTAEIFPYPKNANINSIFLDAYPLSEERLLLRDFSHYDYKEGVGLNDTYYIFEPDTKAVSKHTIFLPNYYTSYGDGKGVYYSSDMKYVLYRSTPVITKDDYQEKYTLFDIENKKAVWAMPPQDSSLRIVTGKENEPHWLNNTALITAALGDEDPIIGTKNYVISLEGTITPLSDLSSDPGFFMAGIYDWSPDNRYLLTAYPAYIWDNEDHVWYKPCLPDENKLESPFAYKSIWPSFDSSYFLATMTFVEDQIPGTSSYTHITKKYVLDVSNKIIYALPENVSQSQFPNLYKDGTNNFLGWLNWEIP